MLHIKIIVGKGGVMAFEMRSAFNVKYLTKIWSFIADRRFIDNYDIDWLCKFCTMRSSAVISIFNLFIL